MKAVRYYGLQDVRCEEVEKPSYGPDEALIKVAYAGICGSDLHIYNKGMFIQNIPETMGHEFAGIIEAVGDQVKYFSPGDAVIANPMVPCMTCESCRKGSYNTCEALGFIGEVCPGCFGEYIAISRDALIPVPTRADLKQIALSEPLAVALNICKRANFQPEDRVALIGVGPIGLLTILTAKSLYGVREIVAVDISQTRLELARQIGASDTYTQLPDSLTFSKFIDAAGQPVTLNTAIQHVEANGYLYVVSIFEKDCTFDINTLVSKQATIVGCNVYTRKNLEDAVRVIAEGKLDVSPIISRVFDITQCTEAFQLLNAADKSIAKVLFQP
ncbi:MAG: zinc-dependent alcohol dehydrogenase [Stomatobaculum sp.]